MKRLQTVGLLASIAGLLMGSVANCSETERGAAEIFCDQANAAWSITTPIPPGRPWISEYVESYDGVQRRLALLIAGAVRNRQSPSARAIGNLYESAIDVRRRDAALLVPLRKDLNEISKLSTPADIARLIARLNRRHQDLIEGSSYPTPTPFALSIWPDPDDSTHYAPQINQSVVRGASGGAEEDFCA